MRKLERILAFLFALLVGFALGFVSKAHAREPDSLIAPVRDDGTGWAGQPAAVRQWFQSLMQPDNPRISCCGEADAYEADAFEVEGDHYVAIITDGKGIIENGTRIPVPNAKMKYDAGNPTGHGIVFIGSPQPGDDGRLRPYGQVLCYVTPGGI
jgi:hypothetical protein